MESAAQRIERLRQERLRVMCTMVSNGRTLEDVADWLDAATIDPRDLMPPGTVDESKPWSPGQIRALLTRPAEES
jgi:hypothetical protein